MSHVEKKTQREMNASLTGRERVLADSKIIVSKTDVRGIITYVNKPFVDISDYTEADVMGKSHNIVRHPDMPRCVFKLLWDTLGRGEEIFAYVVNRTKFGDHYWVHAHVTPSYDNSGKLFGYHSSRRAPRRDAVDAVIPLYKELRHIENLLGGKDGIEASTKVLLDILSTKKITYGQFVFSL